MKKLKLLLLLFLAINLSSCEDLFKVKETSACEYYKEILGEYSNAGRRFAANPTNSNCLNYKSKARKLIDAGLKCSSVSSSQLTLTQEVLRKYNCNEFD